MICTSCGAENRADRRFCRECGLALEAGCPVCGASNEPGDRFCGTCGSALETMGSQRDTGGLGSAIGPGTAPTTERRLVSVLFADLVGFTAASESADPEAVQTLQRRYFVACREVIERFGGTVEKFVGDAVMAVWGAPVAREDDADRAVRAALDLVDAVARIDHTGWDRPLEARAAVMTGEAATTIGASGQGMVSGDLVNSAARLQGAAEPGWVLVDDATRQATEASISFESAGDRALKGKAMALAAWRALGVFAGRGGAGRTIGLEAPFVGRSGELHLLKELLHATGAESKARLVSIMGVAGIGKSRLAWELEKHIDGISEDIYWHQGRSPAYGEGVAFWALGEMVRGRAGIAETDDPEVARERLAAALDDYLTDADERRWIGPRLAGLLGLEEAPTTERSDLFAAWRTFFERVSERGTTVMVFEDIQWADQGLLDFIESILEWSRARPILIVTLARPELFERREDWGRGARSFTSMHLEPLDKAAIRELLAGLAPDLPVSLTDHIAERSEGIPLYAVEMVRMLIGEGRLVPQADGSLLSVGDAGSLRVPDTLRGLIAARLDALESQDRSLVQDASVLGQSFTSEGLAAIAGMDRPEVEARLSGLVRREIVALDVDPRSPERGQYAFVQGLLREVAYATLAKVDRRSRHLAAVRYFESSGSDEITPIVADHYLRAHEATQPGPEADALAMQARRALRAAGERAAVLHANVDAQRFFEQALGLTSDPREAAELHERAGDAARAGVRPEAAEEHHKEAVAAYRSLGDRPGMARATAAQGRVLNDRYAVSQATSVLEAGQREVGDLGDDPGFAALLAELARAYMFVDDDRHGVPMVDRALEMAERLELIPVIADGMVTKGNFFEKRRLREAIALQRGAASLAQANGLVSIQLRALNNLAARLWNEDPQESLSAVQEAVDLSRRYGDEDWLLSSVAWSAEFAINMGTWDDALALLDEYDRPDLPPDLRVGYGSSRLNILAYRGEIEAAEAIYRQLEPLRAELGRAEDLAFPFLDRAVIDFCRGEYPKAISAAMAAIAAAPSLRLWSAWSAAQSTFAVRDLDGARRVVDIADAAGDRGRYFLALRQCMRGGLAMLEGDLEKGLRDVREATGYMRVCDVRLDLALGLLAVVRLAPADHPARAEAATEARSIIDGLGARALGDMLDAALAVAPAADPATPASRAATTAIDSVVSPSPS